MFGQDTDSDWQTIGKTDPWYGVLGDQKYLRENLTEEAKEEFFASGREHLDAVLSRIHEMFDKAAPFRRALDFGCGVGRVAVPLSEVCAAVVGVDVSEAMLLEAKKNCNERHAGNVSFVKSDDTLSGLSGTFDLIHSFIVFQHIPTSRGERILANLLARLDTHGVAVVHFTYAKSRPGRFRLRRVLKQYVPGLKGTVDLIRGRRFRAPETQMNCYDLNSLFRMVQLAAVRRVNVEFTDHGGNFGVLVYFQKAGGTGPHPR